MSSICFRIASGMTTRLPLIKQSSTTDREDEYFLNSCTSGLSICCGHPVVVVDPLLPDYWGESASVVFWGFAASFSRQLSSRAATPEGSLHKSRAESVVGICGQLKGCCVVCS